MVVPSQMRLAFPGDALTFESLVVTSANEAAVSAVKRWESWPDNRLCIVGPPECGLAVLARLWSQAAEATVVSAATFDAFGTADLNEFAARNCAIDLVDEVTNPANLLMLLNLAAANGTRLLLTARRAPETWTAISPDLRSRLNALPVTEIHPPDDEMILRRLQAGCRRHYIKFEDDEARYIAIRLERSYAAIENYVRRLDAAVSDYGRAPSVHLARTVLEEGTYRGSSSDDEPA